MNFIDLHIIQTLPFSNPNRDDFNQPKTVFYGGVDRSRISSQSVKQLVRHRVESRLGEKAVRTRRIPAAVAAELQTRGWESGKAKAAGQAVITAAAVKGLGIGDNGGTTGMLFLPENAISKLADLAEENHQELLAAAKDPKKNPDITEKVTGILGSTNPSIALFGRMLANSAPSTVDGAVAMAHSMTTHATDTEADFFTAVDDLPSEHSGSAHMDTAAFTSGAYYRYASLSTGDLLTALGGDTELAQLATTLFLEETALYVPHAKKNSTAPYTPPALVYVTVRSDRPVSLAGAFEAPVRATRSSGWVTPSVTALAEHVRVLSAFYGTGHLLAALHTGSVPSCEDIGLGTHIPSLAQAVEHATTTAYQDGAR